MAKENLFLFFFLNTDYHRINWWKTDWGGGDVSKGLGNLHSESQFVSLCKSCFQLQLSLYSMAFTSTETILTVKHLHTYSFICTQLDYFDWKVCSQHHPFLLYSQCWVWFSPSSSRGQNIGWVWRWDFSRSPLISELRMASVQQKKKTLTDSPSHCISAFLSNVSQTQESQDDGVTKSAPTHRGPYVTPVCCGQYTQTIEPYGQIWLLVSHEWVVWFRWMLVWLPA